MMIHCPVRNFLPVFGLAFALSASVLGADWPQFRGPAGAGISADPGFASQWSETKNLKWKAELPGPGSSSPIVWGDKVFVTCYSGYGVPGGGDPADLKRHLLCLSRLDGKVVWQQTVDSAAQEDRYTGYITDHGYASHTPATDGQAVYAFFGKSGVVAFSMDGKKLWQTSVGTMSDKRRWGSATSVALCGNLVVVNAAAEDRAVYGLDKATGKVVWKAPGAQLDLAYGTPMVAASGDKTDLLLALPGEIWALNPETGKLRWYVISPLAGNVCPCVVVDQEALYAFGGYPRTGSVAVKRQGKGDATATNILWKSDTGSYVGTPVLHEGHLYWMDERGFACCLEAQTGKLVFRQDLKLTGRGKMACYAGTVLADGKLYSVSRTGGAVVWAAKPQFQEIARNQLPSDTSDFNATPALSNGDLFLRSNRFLYCIGEAKGE